MKIVTFTVSFCLFALGLSQTISAQDQVASSSASATDGSGIRQQDRLNGHVRRVRIETVNLLVKEGKTVEGPRVVREITTYDQKGQKIDFVAYQADDSRAVGKQYLVGNKQYLYDAKGNIIEMLLRGNDGSILNKERYEYQFDEFGNWKQKSASIAVYENGKVGYEPFEITYRTITYYYGEPAPKVPFAPTVTPISNTSTTAAATVPPQITKPTIDAPVSAPATELADVKKTSNAVKAIVAKPEKSEPSTTTAAAVTPKGDAPKVRLTRMSEESFRKAAIDLPQPLQSATSPRANGESTELKSQAHPGISNLKILQPGDSVDAGPPPSIDAHAPATSPYANGYALLASGKYSEAAEVLKQATDLDPNDAAAYAKLGQAYTLLKNYKEAVVVFKRAIKIKPQNVDAEAYYHLSNAYAALEKFPNALEAIKQAMFIQRAEQANPEIANTPKSLSLADLHYATGLAYYNLRRYSAAIEELNHAIALNPKRAQAHFGLALSYLASGNRRSAEKQHEALESLDPVYAARIAKLLSSTPTQQQGFGFVIRVNP